MTNGVSTITEKKLLLFDGHALAFHSWFTRYPNEVIPTYSHPFSSTRTRPSYHFGSAGVQSFAQ